MAYPVIMPRQGQSVESCILGKWHKNLGDAVSAGDLLFTYETDKSTFDEFAKESGTLIGVFYEEGDDVECLKNVCVIGNPGESPDEFKDGGQMSGGPSPDSLQKDPDEKTGLKTEIAAETKPTSEGGIKISPRARRLAERSGAEPSEAIPTGPNGRVIERDIEILLSEPKKTAAVISDTPEMKKTLVSELPQITETGSEFVKHTKIRQTIAKSMNSSLSSMAQLTLNSSFDASDILSFRAKIKEKGKDNALSGLTIGDIVLFAVTRTLLKHKPVNAHYDDDGMKLYNSVNLGVAVDTDRGLMVPTIFNADKMSLGEISGEVRRLASACREGNINPDELFGGTFTVTNLGALGVESFTPVINPPQTAILGVCSIAERVRAVEGRIETYPAMGLSLTFDHRAVDGAPAARYLKDLTVFLTDFTFNAAVGG